MTHRAARIAAILLPLVGALWLCNRQVRHAWRAAEISDTDTAMVSLEGGPWSGGRVRVTGLPRIGSGLSGSRRWLGFDARDGYYTVTDASSDTRTAHALWVANPTVS